MAKKDKAATPGTAPYAVGGDGKTVQTPAAKYAADIAKTNAGIAAAKTPKVTKSGLPALPRLKRARKPKPPQVCACGCGKLTAGGRFLPGHDARLHGWALRVERKVVTLAQVEASDGVGVRTAVEAYLKAGKKKAG